MTAGTTIVRLAIRSTDRAGEATLAASFDPLVAHDADRCGRTDVRREGLALERRSRDAPGGLGARRPRLRAFVNAASRRRRCDERRVAHGVRLDTFSFRDGRENVADAASDDDPATGSDDRRDPWTMRSRPDA